MRRVSRRRDTHMCQCLLKAGLLCILGMITVSVVVVATQSVFNQANC